jgi:multiple sugar transport system permease protein
MATIPPTATEPAPELTAPPAARRLRAVTDGRLAALFISPALLLLLFLSIFPLFWALYLSFTDFSATRDVGSNWIWFENYVDLLTSSQVHQRAITTAVFVVSAIVLQTLLGFTIAYLISAACAAAAR